MPLNKFLKLIFWIVLFESIGILLGLQTQANIAPWYQHLHKSALTPPGFIFSIIWTLLYALLAIIAWVLSDLNKSASNKITTLFALQMLMNWLWTPIFFGMHCLILSAIWLVTLTGLNTILIIKTIKTHKTIAWLLMPYLVWLAFASYLNLFIAFMN